MVACTEKADLAHSDLTSKHSKCLSVDEKFSEALSMQYNGSTDLLDNVCNFEAKLLVSR